MSLSAFLATARPSGPSPSGNNPEGVALAQELRDVVRRHADQAPRSQQVHLGPSELGAECDRQIVGKLTQQPRVNHVADPWPSIVGTSIHAWLADAFASADPERWLSEKRVTPFDGHSGTADLYDAHKRVVIDHKCLGPTTHDKLRVNGPSRTYFVQILLYALGYVRAGFPVEAVALAAWPRTGSSLAGLYVWHHTITPEDWQLLGDVFEQTNERKRIAGFVGNGEMRIEDVSTTPGEWCYFCPFYQSSPGRSDVGCRGNAVE